MIQFPLQYCNCHTLPCPWSKHPKKYIIYLSPSNFNFKSKMTKIYQFAFNHLRASLGELPCNIYWLCIPWIRGIFGAFFSICNMYNIFLIKVLSIFLQLSNLKIKWKKILPEFYLFTWFTWNYYKISQTYPKTIQILCQSSHPFHGQFSIF